MNARIYKEYSGELHASRLRRFPNRRTPTSPSIDSQVEGKKDGDGGEGNLLSKSLLLYS